MNQLISSVEDFPAVG